MNAGGMHHASFDNGGGWCVYDDWTLALRKLRRETGNVIQKAMLIDLDVHQVGPQLLPSHIRKCRISQLANVLKLYTGQRACSE